MPMACVYRKRALILAYQRPFLSVLDCLGLAPLLNCLGHTLLLNYLGLTPRLLKSPLRYHCPQFPALKYSDLKYSAWKYTVLQCPIGKYPALRRLPPGGRSFGSIRR